MRLSVAQELIDHKPEFAVSFEVRDGGALRGERVPERDEPGFASEQEAWAFARQLVEADDHFVNFYVVDHRTSTPVKGCCDRIIRPYGY